MTVIARHLFVSLVRYDNAVLARASYGIFLDGLPVVVGWPENDAEALEWFENAIAEGLV